LWRLPLSLNGLGRAFVRTLFALLLAGLVAWNVGLLYIMVTETRMHDFARFYYSALAFWQGQDMYGPRPPQFTQLSEQVAGRQFGNMNPPHFHLLMLPLALLPPFLALGAWGILNSGCLYWSWKIVKSESKVKLSSSQCWIILLGFLSFVGTHLVLLTAQLSWLLLLPTTLAWRAARNGRWSRAGVYLGLLISVKPFLAVFLPYCLLRRQWNAVVTLCASGLCCFLVGLLAFGIPAHWAWLSTLSSIDWIAEEMNASLLGFITRTLSAPSIYCTLTPLVVAPDLIRPLWIFSVLLIAGLTLVALRKGSSKATAVDRDFALLLLAALLLSPLGWTYYLWLPLGPLIALLHKWWLQFGMTTNPVSFFFLSWKHWLLLAAIPGLVWPVTELSRFQPHAWATMSIGSIYFWSTFFLWIALLADWWIAGEGTPALPQA
jgi:hypothetical protein